MLDPYAEADHWHFQAIALIESRVNTPGQGTKASLEKSLPRVTIAHQSYVLKGRVLHRV
ncbi:MAG: hypothetical protein F6K42_02510 [Leptolyngbya sp. SIO1D8]|nr:hypothetical protein [Leptolyngbya sp. SIO1D8]